MTDSSWQLESQDGLRKTVLSCAENAGLRKYVKIKVDSTTFHLRTLKRKQGTTGKLLRISQENKNLADKINVSPADSGVFRFRVFWFFHSWNLGLGLVALVLLAAGTVLTAVVEISSELDHPGHQNLGGSAWAGLSLTFMSLVLAGVREFFTEPI